MAQNRSHTRKTSSTLLDECVGRSNGDDDDDDNDDQWSNGRLRHPLYLVLAEWLQAACSGLESKEPGNMANEQPADRMPNHAHEDNDTIQEQLVCHCLLSESATQESDIVGVDIDLDCNGSSDIQPEELSVTEKPREADESPKTSS